MTIPEAVKVAQLFERTGGDAVEVSSGVSNFFEAVRTNRIPVDAILNMDPYFSKNNNAVKKVMAWMMPYLLKNAQPIHNYNVDAANQVKLQVSIPVIVVGGLRKLSDMEQVIEENKADYISLCRPLIIEPELVNRFQKGSQVESKCIDCGYCLLGLMQSPLRCYYGRLPKPKT